MITKYNNLCVICGKPVVEQHHIFKGVKQRHLADEDGLILSLCKEHHTGNMSVHQKKELNVLCQIIGELAYEKKKCAEGYSEDAARDSFRMRYGKNYI